MVLLQFISDCVECDSSLGMMEQVLASDEIGRDEQNTLSLLRKLDVCDRVFVHACVCTCVCTRVHVSACACLCACVWVCVCLYAH